MALGAHRMLTRFVWPVFFKVCVALVVGLAPAACHASGQVEAGRQIHFTTKIGEYAVEASYTCPFEGSGEVANGMRGPSPEHRAIVQRFADGLVVVSTFDRPEVFCNPGTYRLGAPDDDFQVWRIMRNDASIHAASDSTAIIEIEESAEGDRASGTAELVREFHLAYRAAAIYEVALRPKSNTPLPGSAQEFDRQLSDRGEGAGVIVPTDSARFCDDLGHVLLRSAKRLPINDYRRADLIAWLRTCSDDNPTFGDEAFRQKQPILVIIGKTKPAKLEDGHWVYALSGTDGDGYVQLCELDGEPCLPPVPDLPRQRPADLTLRSGDAELRVVNSVDGGEGFPVLIFRNPNGRTLLIFIATQYQPFEIWSK